MVWTEFKSFHFLHELYYTDSREHDDDDSFLVDGNDDENRHELQRMKYETNQEWCTRVISDSYSVFKGECNEV